MGLNVFSPEKDQVVLCSLKVYNFINKSADFQLMNKSFRNSENHNWFLLFCFLICNPYPTICLMIDCIGDLTPI